MTCLGAERCRECGQPTSVRLLPGATVAVSWCEHCDRPCKRPRCEACRR